MIHSQTTPTRDHRLISDEQPAQFPFQTVISTCLLLGVCLLVACAKEEPATSAPVPASTANSLNLAAPVPQATAPVTPIASPSANPESKPSGRPGQLAEDGTDIGLNKLNEAVQEFRENQERLPSSLTELVAKGYLRQLPQPPSGKRYHLDASTGHVSLANP